MAKPWKHAATVILAARTNHKSNIVDKISYCSKGKEVTANAQTNIEIPNFDYKVLMLKRSSKSPFMPDAYVFPGGKIAKYDFSDKWCDLAKQVFNLKNLKEYSLSCLGIVNPCEPENGTSSTESEDEYERPKRLSMFAEYDGHARDVASEIGFRLGVIRETFEETGILMCTDKKYLAAEIHPETEKFRVDKDHLLSSCVPNENYDSNSLADWRRRVYKDGQNFLEMCTELNVFPNIWMLHDWSSWLTPTYMPEMHSNRRYDTAFYLGCLPSVPTTSMDEKEIVDYEWEDPMEILCRYYAEEIWLSPPQIYELCRFCSKPQLRDLMSFAIRREKHGFQHYFPVRIACEDGLVAVLPGDEHYPRQPDYKGKKNPIQVSQSIMDMRLQTRSHNRIELPEVSKHSATVQCNVSQSHGHLSPAYGIFVWEKLRDAYKAWLVKANI